MPTIKRLCVGDVVIDTTSTQEVLVVKLSDNQTLYRVVSKRNRVTGLDIYTDKANANLVKLGYGKGKLYQHRVYVGAGKPDIWGVNLSNTRGQIVQATGPTYTSAMINLVAASAKLPSLKCHVVAK